MTNRPRTSRPILRIAYGVAFALSALSVLSVVSNTWGQQPPSTAQGQPAAKGATPGPGSQRKDVDDAQAREGLEVQEAQLEARRTLVRIDELRAEHAKRWKAYYEKMVREGKVIEDRMLAARDDVMMMDAHVAAERAELKVAEIRLKYARRNAGQGDQAARAADQAKEESDVLGALLDEKRRFSRSAKPGPSRPGGRKPITRSCSAAAWPPKTWCSPPRMTCC